MVLYVGARVGNEIGRVKRVVLPSTFTGSPRHMRGLYQDAMTMVEKLGKPDLFITMTCNPNWPEIKSNLLPGQSPNDRNDLLAKVFRLKLDALLEDLVHHQRLGKPVGHIHTIEFQKRGLPHAHLLMMLAQEDKPRNPDEYDDYISAEIPDPVIEGDLYQTISLCNMHGPCGEDNPEAPCMKDCVCSKHFPKEFSEVTKETDGYPEYRRRQDGRTVKKIVRVQGRRARQGEEGENEEGEDDEVEEAPEAWEILLDNRHVVPYNRALSKKYDAHINVEYCATIKAVKYLYK